MPVQAVLWRFVVRHVFFATNHGCAFNRLHYSAAFVATIEFDFVLGGLQLFLNTFGERHFGCYFNHFHFQTRSNTIVSCACDTRMGNCRNVCCVCDFLCAQEASNVEMVLFLSASRELPQLYLSEPPTTPFDGVGGVCSSIPIFFHISSYELLGTIHQQFCLVLKLTEGGSSEAAAEGCL